MEVNDGHLGDDQQITRRTNMQFQIIDYLPENSVSAVHYARECDI